jgi:hypothetical protein
MRVWEILFNANFTTALDAPGSAFEPSLRNVNHITDKWTVGIEYFANLGPLGEVVPGTSRRRRSTLWRARKLFGAEVSAGVGYGLTAASRGPSPRSALAMISNQCRKNASPEGGENMSKTPVLAALALLLCCSTAQAGSLKFLNRTGVTIVNLQFAPPLPEHGVPTSARMMMKAKSITMRG